MNKYQDKWENRSSIRTRPRKYIDFSKEGYFFPADKQLLLLLPDVVKLGEEVKRDILVQSFYKYLDDITSLEIKSVVSACNLIIQNDDLIVNYDEDTKLNAYTALIDEYYHVYMARDMINQLEKKFPQLHRLKYPISNSYNAIQVIKGKLDIKYHDIFEILAVCIFETTLVRELVEFFNSPDIHPSIQYYVNDHMNDESKHYGYFYDLLCFTWNSLPTEYQDSIGIHLGEFVTFYLNISSEKFFNKLLLASIIGDEEKAITLVDGLYQGFEITSEIPIVKNVLGVFAKSGLSDNPNVKSGFLQHNLVLSDK